MSIFIQHGSGKGEKIDKAFAEGVVDGVIFDARREKPENLEACVESFAENYPLADILIDPQFHSLLIKGASIGKLPDYDYYQNNIATIDFISPRKIAAYVKQVIDYQKQNQISYIISPTIRFLDFEDQLSAYSLIMANESIDYHSKIKDPPPLYLALNFFEHALTNKSKLDGFLDIISSFDVKGFYITIDRTSTVYNQHIDEAILTNLLYLIYALSEVNEYEVVVGYVDIVGLLLQSVGAKATACGWHGSLRHLSYETRTGGRQPRPRYTSIPLLNTILLIPEMATALKIDKAIMTGTSLDGILSPTPNPDIWPLEISTLHHWESMSNALNQILKEDDVLLRIKTVIKMINNAKRLYGKLIKGGIPFEPQSDDRHLDVWLNAIKGFCRIAGITI